MHKIELEDAKQLSEKRHLANKKEYEWFKTVISTISILLGLLLTLNDPKSQKTYLAALFFIVSILSGGLGVLCGLLFLFADTDTDHRTVRDHARKLSQYGHDYGYTITSTAPRKIFSVLRICFFFFLIVFVFSLVSYGISIQLNFLK